MHLYIHITSYQYPSLLTPPECLEISINTEAGKQTYLKYCGSAINNGSKCLFKYFKNSITSSITLTNRCFCLTHIIINSGPPLNRYTAFQLLGGKRRKQWTRIKRVEIQSKKAMSCKTEQLILNIQFHTVNKTELTSWRSQIWFRLRFTWDFDSFDCFGGVVGDVDVDTDGFSMVVELRERVKRKRGLEKLTESK